jgi:glucokinase
VSAAGRVVALDLGGTHVSAATVDMDAATVVPETRVRAELTADADRDELLDRIGHAASAASSGSVEAAGVAAPGPFDYAAGICLLEHKLKPLHGVDLRALLASRLSLEPECIRFLNDAEAFVLGEAWAGAARGHERVLGITIGTGLGSAFLEHGSIVRAGPHVPPGGELYRLPFRGGAVEERVSRGAILTRYGATNVDVADIAARARDGDTHAREAFDALATDLADLLRPWAATFEPSCLVVGGSIARSWDLLRSGLAPLEADGVVVVTAAANIEDAALLGAARRAAAERAA